MGSSVGNMEKSPQGGPLLLLMAEILKKNGRYESSRQLQGGLALNFICIPTGGCPGKGLLGPMGYFTYLKMVRILG